MGIEVRPLNPTIGAEVWGSNVLALTDEVLADIHEAWSQHSVIFSEISRGWPRNNRSASPDTLDQSISIQPRVVGKRSIRGS